MNLLVVSDIFGSTKPLNDFAAQLLSFYGEIIVIDPYDGQNIQFSSEEDAYKYFQINCGIKQLTKQLAEEVEKSKDTVDIIGFSVGGTSAWEISGSETSKSIRNIVCFYSSRIREKTSIAPRFPTTVVFPSFEKSFDLEPVIQSVEKNTNVEVIRTNHLHGFMNKNSVNYSAAGYKHFLTWFTNKVA
jgi:dienelactone hydrolase